MNNRTDHGFLILADVSGSPASSPPPSSSTAPTSSRPCSTRCRAPLAPARDPGDRGRRGVRARRGRPPLPNDPAAGGAGRGLRRLQEPAAGDAGRRELPAAGRASRPGRSISRWSCTTGPFLRHTVAGRNRVTGTAVILVHRLLKNGLGGRAATRSSPSRCCGHSGIDAASGRPAGAHRALRAPGRRALLRARPQPPLPPSPRWGEGRVRGWCGWAGFFTRRRSRRRR